ncbi:hypothetical protein EMIT043CA1_50240 [Pseudomonas brassicacearum]
MTTLYFHAAFFVNINHRYSGAFGNKRVQDCQSYVGNSPRQKDALTLQSIGHFIRLYENYIFKFFWRLQHRGARSEVSVTLLLRYFQ